MDLPDLTTFPTGGRLVTVDAGAQSVVEQAADGYGLAGARA